MNNLDFIHFESGCSDRTCKYIFCTEDVSNIKELNKVCAVLLDLQSFEEFAVNFSCETAVLKFTFGEFHCLRNILIIENDTVCILYTFANISFRLTMDYESNKQRI